VKTKNSKIGFKQRFAEEQKRINQEVGVYGQRNYIHKKSLLWLQQPYADGMWDTIKDLCPDPKIVVELGSNIGRWPVEMIERFPAIERIYCVDVWPHDEYYEEWKQRTNNPRVIPLRGTTDMWSKQFQETQPIDLLYIDAAHDYESCKKDLANWVPKVRNGGVVMLDDWVLKSVKTAVFRFARIHEKRGHKIDVKSGKFGGDYPKNENEQAWFIKNW
jgi:hypothetical protein